MNFPDAMTVKSITIPIVPRFNETDKAGIVHNSVFSIYWEIGRTELLRANGVAYSDLERAGVFFVVAALDVKFRRPAHYDEQLRLTASIAQTTAAKVVHAYQLFRAADNLLLAEGSTTIACVDANGKMRRLPEFMYPTE